MSSLSSTLHALHAAISDGTYRPELGGVRSMEAALRRMTPEQLERLRSPWPSLSRLSADRHSQPAVLRLLSKTVEER